MIISIYALPNVPSHGIVDNLRTLSSTHDQLHENYCINKYGISKFDKQTYNELTIISYMHKFYIFRAETSHCTE